MNMNMTALEVAESARSEAKEWRRKFMVTKEVADDSSKKLTDVRVEFNSLRREKEALLTDVESLARKNLEAAGQAELAEAARAAREKEGKEAEIDTNGRVEELSQRLKALGNTNKMLQSQADKMRVTAGEVEGELASLRANHGEKLRELAGANEAVRGAMGQKEKVLMRERDTEEELIRTKVLKTKFQNEAEEAEAKVEVLKNENKENKSRLTDLQAEVRGSESTIATLASTLRRNSVRRRRSSVAGSLRFRFASLTRSHRSPMTTQSPAFIWPLNLSIVIGSRLACCLWISSLLDFGINTVGPIVSVTSCSATKTVYRIGTSLHLLSGWRGWDGAPGSEIRLESSWNGQDFFLKIFSKSLPRVEELLRRWDNDELTI